MPPAETSIGIGHRREPVASQHMQYGILDNFNSRREIRYQMLLVCIQAQHDKICKEFGDTLVRTTGSEDLLIDLRQIIGSEATRRIRPALNGAQDLGGIKRDQCVITLPYLPYSIQYRHDPALWHAHH